MYGGFRESQESIGLACSTNGPVLKMFQLAESKMGKHMK